MTSDDQLTSNEADVSLRHAYKEHTQLSKTEGCYYKYGCLKLFQWNCDCIIDGEVINIAKPSIESFDFTYEGIINKELPTRVLE